MDRPIPRTLVPSLALSLVASLVAAPPVAAQTEEPVLLTADDAEAGDLFGCAFDLAATPNVPGLGGILLVGSLQDDDRGTDSGAVVLFELTPDGWTERAKGLTEAGAPGDLLGYDVALADAAGGAYLAGAPGADGGRGRLHLFLGVNETGFLGESAVLDDPSGQPGAGFGTSLAVLAMGNLLNENALVAVGAPGTDDGRGVAYLVGQGRSSLGPALALLPPETARNPGDGLGWAVAWSGPFVVVGAPWADAPLTDSGTVHLFLGVEHLERLDAPDPRAFDAFGYAVAARGNLVAVGAPRSDLGGPGSGAVHVYRLLEGSTGSLFQLEATLAGFPGEQLGTSVAFEGPGRLAAGARNADLRTGLVRRYAVTDEGWQPAGTFRPPGVVAGDELGIAVAASGDLFAAGAYRDDVDGLVDAGSVWVTEPAIEEPPRGTDLFVSAVDVTEGASPGVTITYRLTNAGPDAGDDIPLVFDDPSGILASPTWSCPGCSPSGGLGSPAGTVTLAPDETATVTVTSPLTQGMFGSFEIVVGIDPPPTALDRTAQDDTGVAVLEIEGPPPVSLVTDLVVTSDDPRIGCRADGLVPGCQVRSNFTVTNTGDTPVAAPLSFRTRRGLRRTSWACTASAGATCTVAKTNGIPDGAPITLPPGGSVTVTVVGLLAPGLTGAFPVTAGVELPADEPSDGSATVTVRSPLVPQASLVYLPEPSPLLLQPGSTAILTLTFHNLGPSRLPALEVSAEPPGSLTLDSWICTPEPGNTCGPGGSGAISDTADLMPGSAVIYALTLTAVAPPSLGDQVTVAVQSQTTDILEIYTSPPGGTP